MTDKLQEVHPLKSYICSPSKYSESTLSPGFNVALYSMGPVLLFNHGCNIWKKRYQKNSKFRAFFRMNMEGRNLGRDKSII